MTKPRLALKPPKRRPFTERASEAAAAFAIEVATDPGESDEDVAAARLAVSRQDPGNMSPGEINHMIMNMAPAALACIGELRIILAGTANHAPAEELPATTHSNDAEPT